MKEVIRIPKDEDRAIILSLKSQQGFKLSSSQIADYVKKFIKSSRGAIYKKIERMRDNEFLLYEVDKSKNYIHWLNPEIEFVLEGPPLRYLKDSFKDNTSIRSEHTSHLKEAIRNWIDNFAEPNPMFFDDGEEKDLSVIDICESHVLFRDLANHLPALDIKIFERWEEYKFDIINLLALKSDLLISLNKRVSGCFERLDFNFISSGKEYPRESAYLLISIDLYDMVIHMERGEYNIYKNKVLEMERDFHGLIKDDEHILLGGEGTFLRFNKKDHAQVEASLSNLMTLIKNIPESEFTEMSKNILIDVDKMKSEREYILRKLSEAMFYDRFPGNCQYLQSD